MRAIARNPGIEMSELVLTLANEGAGKRVYPEISPQIVARARSGDQDAFHAIFQRFGRPVLSFINQLVYDQSLAEELSQETFVRAYRNLRSLGEDSKISTWLFGIARNVVRESMRQSIRRKQDVSLDEPTPIELQADCPTPAGEILGRELNQEIRRALVELDDDKRLVFSLKVFHGKSYEEISGITGHSIGKLKTDLHRARIELKSRLSGYLETGKPARN